MKVIILAGGLGTRLSEETSDKPKPMVLIGEKPMLWHIMNVFVKQGAFEFIIASGYKHEVIEDYVASLEPSWNVKCEFTGLDSQTGWRIGECLDPLTSEGQVIVTYGDGLGNININKLIEFHERHGKKVTVTAVRPPARFGVLEFENGRVIRFGEKNQSDSGWINGGFFVIDSSFFKFHREKSTSFESDILPQLAAEGELMAYQHHGFWQPMDTLRERNILAELAGTPQPPWETIEA